MPDGHVLAAALLGLAGLSAASPRACRPETFPFPAMLGTRHVGTTAAVVRNYTGFPGFAHEATVTVPASAGVRPFCNVTVSYTHPGHDDVVSVHVWLPLEEEEWNGRFLGLGGGGFVVGDVDGDGPAAAVQEGYAAATTDGGHVAGMPAEAWALREAGNLDWPLLVNFGHRSPHELAVVGKSVTRAFYGGGGGEDGKDAAAAAVPRWSYWRGCSTGGRQGLALAQRYPEDFDGVLSVCPAIDFPAMVTSLYHPQLVMRRMGYWPSECELAAIVAAGVEACDMTDGVADGIVGRLDGCVFDVRAAEGRAYVCDTDGVQRKVSRRAVEVVEAVMKGVVDEEGESMAPGYVPGAPLAGMFAMMNSVCEDEADRTAATGGCKGAPFAIAEDWIRLFIEKDPGFDVAGLTERTFRDVFRRGVEEFGSVLGSGSPAPDLRRFRERGGKVLMWHGMADQAVPVESVRGVYERARRLDAARGVDTAEYWRYFEVPGVNHCVSMGGGGAGGRPAPFPWDAFERLRGWVEDGVAPEELEARRVVPAGEGGPRMVFEDEVRRVCRWPEEGVWDGEGWRCLKPGEKLAGAVAGEKDEL